MTNRRAFTLVELLTVIAMIAIIMAALVTSVTAARERARIQKATSEVKVITQAILGYENYDTGGQTFELPTMKDRTANKSAIGFLIGQGGSAQSGGKIPALLMAQLTGGGNMLDPWGTPYRISIKAVTFTPKFSTASGLMQTGYYLPNFYRISEEER